MEGDGRGRVSLALLCRAQPGQAARAEKDVPDLLDQADRLAVQALGFTVVAEAEVDVGGAAQGPAEHARSAVRLGMGTGFGEAGQRLLVPSPELVGEAEDDECRRGDPVVAQSPGQVHRRGDVANRPVAVTHTQVESAQPGESTDLFARVGAPADEVQRLGEAGARLRVPALVYGGVAQAVPQCGGHPLVGCLVHVVERDLKCCLALVVAALPYEVVDQRLGDPAGVVGFAEGRGVSDDVGELSTGRVQPGCRLLPGRERCSIRLEVRWGSCGSPSHWRSGPRPDRGGVRLCVRRRPRRARPPRGVVRARAPGRAIGSGPDAAAAEDSCRPGSPGSARWRGTAHGAWSPMSARRTRPSAPDPGHGMRAAARVRDVRTTG